MSRAEDLWKLKCSRSIFISRFSNIMRIKIQQSSRDAVCEVSKDALLVCYIYTVITYVDASRLDLQQQFESVYTRIIVIMLQLHMQMVRNFYNK